MATVPILFVDAYDSFTNNIVALLYECIPSAEILVVHNDSDITHQYQLDLPAFIARFDAVVLGPGPGDPRHEHDIGNFGEIIRVAAGNSIPVLGICLGFQALCLEYGCTISGMSLPCHGQVKVIATTAEDIFHGIQDNGSVRAVCYNSLAVQASLIGGSPRSSRSSSPGARSISSSVDSSLAPMNNEPEDHLILLAWDTNGNAMAVRHKRLPFWGLQFHPESCMSYDGEQIIKNWWSEARQSHNSSGPFPSITRHLPVDLHRHRRCLDKRRVQPTCSGKVNWRMRKLGSLKSQDLAEYTYETTSNFPVAVLESTSKGRYCIYGFADATSKIVEYIDGVLISRNSERILSEVPMSTQEALQEVEVMTKSLACTGGCANIPFWGGWIGFLSYELGLDLLDVSSPGHRLVPDFSLVFIERSVVFDQRTGNFCIQSTRPADDAWVTATLEALRKLNNKNSKHQDTLHDMRLQHVLDEAECTLPNRSTYTSSFSDCQKHLHAGNSYELCLTTEAIVKLPSPDKRTSFQIYQNLNKHNPVPYAALLRMPSQARISGTTILSTSPELFLSCSRTGTLDMMPMKGTVQRTPDTTLEDAYRILHTPKETAENLMIADLIRHDLYSVVGCKPYPWFEQSPDPTQPAIYASRAKNTMPSEEDAEHKPLDIPNTTWLDIRRGPLSIPALNTVRAFETVYQLVSHIRAHPPHTLDISDPEAVISHNQSALKHVLPPGSMTGAPKKRSCEILHTLERRSRGAYSGIIGYMDVGGGSCWSVAIRTAFSSEAEDSIVSTDEEQSETEAADGCVHIERRKQWHVGAGGAVTVLSNEEGEWQEMMGKMNNVLKGFRVSKDGDRPDWRPEL